MPNFKLPKILTVSALMLTTACAFNGQLQRPENEADPYENVNRKISSFNEGFYENILFPIARGYRKITTPTIRERVNSFIANVDEPINAVNYLLQLEFVKSLKSIGRFAVNTTMGLGGLFDVAPGWNLAQDTTSFNETLASWCVVQGPYLVVPFIGPNSGRGLVGTVVDAAADPVYWLTYHDANTSAKISYPYAAVKYTAKAESFETLYNDLHRNSVDFYSTMRSAYLQNQQKYHCRFAAPRTAETYDFDFELDEDDSFEQD